MDERRQKQRHRTLKTGVITLNHGGGFDCVVRNLSDIGACLEFESPVGIPDTFMLMVKPERIQHPCQVIWRSPRKIGVSFAGDSQEHKRRS